MREGPFPLLRLAHDFVIELVRESDIGHDDPAVPATAPHLWMRGLSVADGVLVELHQTAGRHRPSWSLSQPCRRAYSVTTASTLLARTEPLYSPRVKTTLTSPSWTRPEASIVNWKWLMSCG